MKRPTGITILAILALIGGILNLIAFIGALGAVFAATAAGLPGGVALAIVTGLLALISGVLLLAFAVGAFILIPWAWTLGLIIMGLRVLGSLIDVATGASVGSLIVSIVIAGVVIWYLYRPHVRVAFGK